ncbi:cysteine hydrolase family protein [Devosia sp.]|uniref:cysteine hydrolase family protein n=1 Tax=Devosia sp. TaxID=1871048 RepID=UPI003265158A
MTTTQPRRALIVVDVQNDYDAGGNLPIEFPPFGQSVQRVADAMDAATANGVAVVVIKMIQSATARVFAEGSHGAALHPEIARRARDHYIEKTMPSAFTGTDLELWLRSHQIDTVTVCGYMTHNCNLSTVIHAAHMGFKVEYLGDASGSLPYANAAGSVTAEEIHRVMTVVIHSRFAAVLDTAEWATHLAKGTSALRGDIYDSNQAARGRRVAAE